MKPSLIVDNVTSVIDIFSNEVSILGAEVGVPERAIFHNQWSHRSSRTAREKLLCHDLKQASFFLWKKSKVWR